MMHVLFAKTEYLKDATVFGKYYATADDARRAKVDRLKFDDDKVLSLGAYQLLSDGVTLSGQNLSDLEILSGEHQKPDFTPSSGLHFNLSHSDEAVMCILSEHVCGCDIERIDGKNLDLSERFFHPFEAAYVRAGKTAFDQAERFTRMWVLKESFMKCTGLGFALPLDRFEIIIPENSRDAIQVKQDVNKKTYRFTEYQPYPGYRAATCIECE